MLTAEQRNAQARAKNEGHKQAVIDQLKAVGLEYTQSGPGYNIETFPLAGDKHKRVYLGAMLSDSRNYLLTRELTGWIVRFDYDSRGGMGTKRYPLRKDGTIDAQRLLADIQQWIEREQARNAANDRIADRIARHSDDFAELRSAVLPLQGRGLFFEVKNDGANEELPFTFKISGHTTKARLLALLSTIEATQGE